MGILDWLRGRRKPQSLDQLMESRTQKVLVRGPFPKCGGCGAEPPAKLELVADKKNNHGYLCPTCVARYSKLLQPDSIRNFWMCGVCGYRVLAGTAVDAEVDKPGNPCPNCNSDVNISLVNLSGDRQVGRGIIGEPVE